MRSLILFMAATLAFAQDKPDNKKAPEAASQPMEAEVIQVKTLTGDSFTRLMKLLEVFHAHVQGDSQLRTIVVYAPKDVAAQMRRVVEQLDRPGSEAAVGKNIDMTLTLLRCFYEAGVDRGPASEGDGGRRTRSCARPLSTKIFSCGTSYRCDFQEGKETTESLRMPGDPAASSLSKGDFSIYPEAVYRKDAVRYVRFSRVNLSFLIPYYTGTFGNNKRYHQSEYRFENLRRLSGRPENRARQGVRHGGRRRDLRRDRAQGSRLTQLDPRAQLLADYVGHQLVQRPAAG